MRRRNFIRAASLLLPLLGAASAATQPRAETSTTIILVRHAEKAAEPKDDPPLLTLGEARAAALVDAVRGAGITAIYSTPYKRTQATARPVSEHLGIPVTTFDAKAGAKSYGDQYAAELLARNRGLVVLVVGHSNTIPSILQGLGIPNAPAIRDEEYDNLFIVTVPDSGAVRMVRARFGAGR
jgi:broad specificity phosphatase PhoE